MSKPQAAKFNYFKCLKSTFLICFLVAFVAFIIMRLPYTIAYFKGETVATFSKMSSPSSPSSVDIFACDFEVFGRVQGVFFRKHTQQTAKKLQLRGWCQNTSEGTVRGQLEGPKPQFDEMRKWLQTTGSPQSRIDRAVFSEPKQIDEYHFKEFSIRR